MTPRSQYRPLIDAACAPVGWDPLLLEAQILIESADDRFAFRYEAAYFDQYLRDHPQAAGFRYGPDAACSRGLLQILWETAIETDPSLLHPWDLYDPATNLRLGLRLLTRLYNRLGSVDAAIAAYNGGTVGNTVPPYRNAAYLQKVRQHQERLRG